MIRSAITTLSVLITLLCSCSDRPKVELPLHAMLRDQTPHTEQKPSSIALPEQASTELDTPPTPIASHTWVPPKPKEIPWPMVARPDWLSGKMPRDFRIQVRGSGLGVKSYLDLRATGQSEFPPEQPGDTPLRGVVARAAMDELWKTLPAEQMLIMAEHNTNGLFCWTPGEPFPSETLTIQFTIAANHHGFTMITDGTCAITKITEWHDKVWKTVPLTK
jgi:hypothetical protein